MVKIILKKEVHMFFHQLLHNVGFFTRKYMVTTFFQPPPGPLIEDTYYQYIISRTLTIEFPVSGGETWPLSFPADLAHYESLGFSQGCSQKTMGAVLFEHSCVNSILCYHLLNPPSQSLWRHIFYGLVCEIKSESALAWGRGAILVK